MGLLPITEKGKPVACQADWPLFYMNDFSQLGIIVNQLSEAVAALQAGGFTVHEDEKVWLLDVNNIGQLNKAFEALSLRRLHYETADLVSCVYQG